MDAKNALEIKEIRKTFHIDSMGSMGFLHKNVNERTVIDGITLNVRKGECLGIVGRNGSGKSTLLKIISGIYCQDSGTIEADGRIVSILELGMGFNPDFSGRENIRIKGSLYGFSKKEVEDMMDDIIEFSALGDQIDNPVRTYSSGMNARLAFSISIHVKCDILILDEILSVGDAGFRSKCSNVFKGMKKEGKTIFLASHSMSTIASMCDRAIWIDGGVIREEGDPHVVSARFEKDLTESYDTVMDLAKTGDPIAMNSLGVMLRDGIRVDVDRAASMEWFGKASELGSADAQINLGRMLLEDSDTDGARVQFEKAAESGNQEAQILLMEISGTLSDDSSSRAVDRLRELAESGNVRAQNLYADALMKGTAVKQDRAMAHGWFLKAAKGGDVGSMLQAGRDYRDGLGVPKDAFLAEEWMSRAAECGNMTARIELANMFRKGITANVDINKAIHWFSKAAEAGDANSMFQLGTIYRDGLGVPKDKDKSDAWFSLFALQNRIRLENNLGDVLRQRHATDEGRSEAVEWYSEASKGDFVQSDFVLGLVYRDGLGVQPDSEEAVKHFAKAAEGWSHLAMYELGNMYLRGNGVKRDPEVAFKHIYRAATMGNAQARYVVGTMYRDGVGVEQDMDKARHWLELSAEYGNVNAINALSKMS